MSIGGGALAGVALQKSAPYLKKIGSEALKVASKAVSYGFNKSIDIIKNTHNSYQPQAVTKSKNLDKTYTTLKKREIKFKGFVEETKNKMMTGKDIRDNLSQMYQLKVPTQKAMKKLNNLAGDYFIKNNLKDGKLDLGLMRKDIKMFAKDIKLSRTETKNLENGVFDRVEQYKDNLTLDKNNKIFDINKTKNEAKNEAKKENKNNEQKIVKKKEEIKKEQEPKKAKVSTRKEHNAQEMSGGKEMGR